MAKKPQEYNISATEFVKAWQSSSSVEEVEQKTGIPKLIASARAASYRKQGIRLKSFTPGRKKPIDVGELNKLIEAMGGGSPPLDAQPTEEKSPEEVMAEEEAKKQRNRELLAKLLGTKKV